MKAESEPFDPTNPVHIRTQLVTKLENSLCRDTLEALFSEFEPNDALTILMNVKINAVGNVLIMSTGNADNEVIADQLRNELLSTIAKISEKYQSAENN